MKITIISGSTRKNSQSIKVANYIAYVLKEILNLHDLYVLNLATANLKFWDESFWDKSQIFDENWNTERKHLLESDGFIIVAPEWNGMIPPALKNLFHLSTNNEFSNKPALLVGISSGINGVYPITELRLNSYKNTYINYIPQHIIVRNVEKVLSDPLKVNNDEDTYIRTRILSTLKILLEYTKALQNVRKSPDILDYPFPNGM